MAPRSAWYAFTEPYGTDLHGARDELTLPACWGSPQPPALANCARGERDQLPYGC